MKKIFIGLACVALAFLVASCSNKSKNKTKNSALSSDIAQKWLCPNYNENKSLNYDIINTEESKGAHIRLSVPTVDDSNKIDYMVRTHMVELTNSLVKNDTLSVTYAVIDSETASLSSSITTVIKDHEADINAKLSDEYKVQTEWVKEDIKLDSSDTGKGLFISFLPMLLQYYTGEDEAKTISLVSFVLVPVKVQKLSYTKENDKIVVEANASIAPIIEWTSNKNGTIE